MIQLFNDHFQNYKVYGILEQLFYPQYTNSRTLF